MTDLDRRSAVRLAILGGGGAFLAGCAAQSAALTGAAGSVTTAVATVPVTAASAVSLYGIAKGIAEVGLTVLELTPQGAVAAAAISAAIALADPIVASLPTLAGDVEALGKAVSAVITQTNTLLLAGAPVISVVANKV